MSSKSHLEQGKHHSNCPKRFCPISYIVEESAVASLVKTNGKQPREHPPLSTRKHKHKSTQKTIVNISLIALRNMLALRQRHTHTQTHATCMFTYTQTHSHAHTTYTHTH